MAFVAAQADSFFVCQLGFWIASGSTHMQVWTISVEWEGLPMSTIAAKELVFVYNGNENDSEVEFDAEGDFPCPTDGSMLNRRGKQWKVARTNVQSATSGGKSMQVLRIISRTNSDCASSVKWSDAAIPWSRSKKGGTVDRLPPSELISRLRLPTIAAHVSVQLCGR